MLEPKKDTIKHIYARAQGDTIERIVHISLALAPSLRHAPQELEDPSAIERTHTDLAAKP